MGLHTQQVLQYYFIGSQELSFQKLDIGGHWLAVVLELNGSIFFLVNIYGYTGNNKSANKTLIHDINVLLDDWKSTFSSDNIIIAGDWNISPNNLIDRHPIRPHNNALNPLILDLCYNLDLTDIWRTTYPNQKQYTWFSPNHNFCSRIDYYLISSNLSQFVAQTEISKAPLTDHCCIILIINPSIQSTSRRISHWKFNCSLLKCEEFCSEIITLIKDVEQDNSMSPMVRWEWFKFKVKRKAIIFGKTSKKRREKQLDIMYNINKMIEKTKLTELENKVLSDLQNQLDNMYMEKSQRSICPLQSKMDRTGGEKFLI